MGRTPGVAGKVVPLVDEELIVELEKETQIEGLYDLGSWMLDVNGKRWVNEPRCRDYVTGEMQKNRLSLRLRVGAA